MTNTARSHSRFRLHAAFSLLALLALCLSGVSLPLTASAAADLVVYDDGLAPGWQNWSYGSTVDLANTNPAVGSNSIAVTPTGAYGALALHAPGPVTLADYSAIRFEVYGAAGGNQLQLYTTATDTSPAGPSAPFDATAGEWKTVTIPFTQLGNPATVQIIAIQDRTGTAQPTLYVDNLRLIGDANEPPPPPPAHPYRQLRDVDVFTGKPNGSYVFSGGGLSIASDGGLIPLDTAQSYNGQPSYRLEVSGSSGYWGAGIARGWLTYSLRNYRTYGALEFNIKGAAGGELVNLALYDLRYERPGGGPLAAEVSATLSRYVTIGSDWHHVKIPLREIIPADSPFDLDSAQVVQFRGLSAGTVWVNDIRFTAPVDEPGFPAIKVNQVGYLRIAEKYALVSGFPEELTADVGTPFSVRAADGSTAFAGTLQLISANDALVSGEKVLLADFSALQTPGSYTLRVEGSGISDSPPFSIGDNVYRPLLTDAMRFFYLQRSGIPLDAAHAGDFARGEGHPQDRQAILRSSTVGTNPVTRTVDVSGGWYDAGDYGRYTSFAGNAVSDLLWAYELFPGQFRDNQFNIPESGNGVPDILDEVRWELDWVRRMQDPATGGFYHLLYPNNPPNDQAMPDKNHVPRYVEDCDIISYNQEQPERSVVGPNCNVKPTSDTGTAVAMLAHGASIFRRIDPAYARQLTEAALKGWLYLELNPTNIVIRGQNGGNENDADNRLWAAAELYRLTGAPRFERYFLAHYAEPQFAKWWTSKTESAFVDDGTLSMRAMLAYMAAPRRDPAVVQWFTTMFTTYRTTMLERQRSLAWRNFLLGGDATTDSDYFWGSNSVTLQISMLLTTGSHLLGQNDAAIHQATRANLHYILGINPLQRSFVTGYGASNAERVYSFQYNWDGRPNPPPGLMVGGPNTYENGVYSRFVGKTWVPNNTNWAASEIGIYWNSPLVFNLAAASAAAGR